MIKTQILLWKTIEGYELGLGLGLFYFILNSTPLTHDVYNMLQTLLGQKKYKEEMSDEQPFWIEQLVKIWQLFLIVQTSFNGPKMVKNDWKFLFSVIFCTF